MYESQSILNIFLHTISIIKRPRTYLYHVYPLALPLRLLASLYTCVLFSSPLEQCISSALLSNYVSLKTMDDMGILRLRSA